MGSRLRGWEHVAAILQVGPRTWIKPLPILQEVEGDVNNGAHWLLQFWRVPADPTELPWFPSLLYLASFICCTEAVQSAFSCLSGGIAVYIGVYFSVLVRGGEFSVLLQCCHLGPVSLK